MNNKVLLVNTKNIKKMIFVDEAGEPSMDIDREDIWVDIPPVFYEALEDYEFFGQMMLHLRNSVKAWIKCLMNISVMKNPTTWPI